MNKKKIYSFQVKEETPYLDLMAEKTPFSKMQLKKFFAAGAVWINENKQDRRVRKVKGTLKPGQKIKLYFDPNIKPFDMTHLVCVHDTHNWGVWYKPAGLLCAGTKYGDEFTLTREIEKRIKRSPFLVHRLDRETSGLIIVAYNKKMARYFSEQIRDKKIRKFYQTQVKGLVPLDLDEIDSPVDGKDAKTNITSVKHSKELSQVEVELITGRKHQIRVHFESISHPVLGDPRYGEDNDYHGLQLVAHKLMFKAPGRGNELEIAVEKEKCLF